MGTFGRTSRFVTLSLLLWVAQALAPAPARADLLTWTLTGSVGFGYEVQPARKPQAENVMATLGLGLLADHLRFELGVLAAYGALWANGPRHAQMELRPMVRLQPPLVPLYVRAIFAGLLPFVDHANFAYGGALGLNIQLGRLGLMAEAGPLPRRVQNQNHWIVEARLGASFRL